MEWNHDRILEAALKWEDHIPREVPPDLESLFSYEAVAAAALEHLVDDDESTHRPLLRVTLPGTPPIEIWSESTRPWKQPWHVRVGGEERTVCSLEIPKALALLIDPRGPSGGLIHGGAYWREGFWDDTYVWGARIGDKLVAHRARQLAEGLEDYARAMERLQIDEARIGHVNQQPLSLQIDLAARDGGLVDTVRWWSVFEEGEPVHAWSDLLSACDGCAAAAAKLPFLAKWKAAGDRREVMLDVVGRAGIAETNVAEFVLPAWRHAGLKGEPEHALLLGIPRPNGRGHDYAQVYFSGHGDGALLTTGDGFPGGEGIMFHPKSPEYAIVAPDGAVTRRRVE